MSSLVDPRDLVGPSDIAARAGVGYAAVSNWVKRYSDFPARVATVGGTPVYLWSEVEAWISARDLARRSSRQKRIRALEQELARLRAEGEG